MGSIVQSRIESAPCKHPHTLQVLRGIATFEMAKGLVFLLAALGLVFLMGRDPWDMADGLLRILHISPDHHFAQAFLDWADTLTAAKLWAVVAAAGAYSILRFVEAYGLWYARAWAEWIALVSGSLYLPFEIYKLFHRQSPLHITILVINAGIVVYMACLLWSGKSLHRIPRVT